MQRRGFKNGGGCWSRHLVGTCVGVALRFPGTCGNTLGRFGSGPIFLAPPFWSGSKIRCGGANEFGKALKVRLCENAAELLDEKGSN